MKRHSYKQVGEEAGKYLYLLYSGIQEVVAKGCAQFESIKAIL